MPEKRQPLPNGTRVRLVEMPNDPDPITPGTEGTVHGGVVTSHWSQIWVRWDNGRTLNLLPGVDKYEVLED